MQRHTLEKVVTELRQAEVDLAQELSLGPVCQKLGVSARPRHRWRHPYGGVLADTRPRMHSRLWRLSANRQSIWTAQKRLSMQELRRRTIKTGS